jgi:hypothetical protein
MCAPCRLPHHDDIPSPFAALDIRPHPGSVLQNVALAMEDPSTLQPMASLWTRHGGQNLRRRALVLPPPGNPPLLTKGLRGALSIRLHTRYVTDRGSGRIEKDADEQHSARWATAMRGQQGPPLYQTKADESVTSAKNKYLLRQTLKAYSITL